jgi:lipid A ethanolaminephosphotransferase
MIAWFSQADRPGKPSMAACLREQRDRPLTHDNLFHSVLGLLGVQASEYAAKLDAFATCRGA